MVAGVSFAVGCFIFAFTATPDVHWIGPCFGIVIMIGKLIALVLASNSTRSRKANQQRAS